MNKLTALFSVGVGGIVVCLIMTGVTAFQKAHEIKPPSLHSIPTPALGN